jgi:ABC-type proline/glycine betaine transport system substrate-binding protein
MKKLVTVLVALGLAVGFTAPTFAANAPKTKSACEKAHMKWDATAKTCS